MKNLFSFIIPVRIDNEERYQNLQCSVSYIRKHFPLSEIIVVENASKPNIREYVNHLPDVRYVFIENDREFSKAKTVNEGALIAGNDFLVVYDLDVLIHPDALHRCAKILLKGRKKIILPHNTIFVNVAGETKSQLSKSLDINFVPQISSLNTKISNPDLRAYPIPSGVVIFERKMFLLAGGYNKKMTSYGWEDIEILKRMAKLGYYPYILGTYNIIHLDHERGPDSMANEFYTVNKAEFLKVVNMPKKELEAYIINDLALEPDGGKSDISDNVIEFKKMILLEKIGYHINRFLNSLQIRGILGLLSYIILRKG